MLIAYQQLTQQLSNRQFNKNPALIYLVAGSEVLLINDSCEAIKSHATSNGYTEHKSIAMDIPGCADILQHELNTNSLFATPKFIELYCEKSKPLAEMKQALLCYCNQASTSQIILVKTPTLTNSETKQTWFKAIDTLGIVIQIWPLKHEMLPNWIKMRMQAVGLSSDVAGYQLIADVTEGNLLAAHQEIQKFRLLYDNGSCLSLEQIKQALANDHTRYDVFELADAALSQQPQYCLKILASLKVTATEPAIVLWALCQDLRKLALLQHAASEQFSTICQQQNIWTNRQKLFKRALTQLSLTNIYHLMSAAKQIDAIIKGLYVDDVWNNLQRLCLAYANPKLITLCQQ